MSKAVVPGIPLAALNYIKDENVKAVLTSLIDGWQMRNNQTGNGDHKFLTQADFEASVTRMIDGGILASGAQTNQVLPPSYISNMIANLQAGIVESKLWKDLGARVALIDIKGAKNTADVYSETVKRVNADNAILTTTNTQFATVNNNLAVVQASVTTMANSYSALSSTVTTVQASVSGLTSSVQQETAARVNADGELYSQYTVKIDNNGYVSGFGLASTVNNSKVLSDFYIRADRFAIGSPTVPRSALLLGDDGRYASPPENLPFIVRTDNWVDNNGVTQNGGVFMKGAWIEYAAIDTAHIRDLSVSTLKIGDHAVSQSFFAHGDGTVIDLGEHEFFGGSVHIVAEFWGWLGQTTHFSIRRNGEIVRPGPTLGWASFAVLSVVDNPAPGNYRYTLVSDISQHMAISVLEVIK